MDENDSYDVVGSPCFHLVRPRKAYRGQGFLAPESGRTQEKKRGKLDQWGIEAQGAAGLSPPGGRSNKKSWTIYKCLKGFFIAQQCMNSSTPSFITFALNKIYSGRSSGRHCDHGSG
jgi:hypothetical protein